MKKRIHLIIALLALCLSSAKALMPSAEISVLTSNESDKAIFTRWGHTGIRVHSEEEGIDKVYNYGVFSFGDNFVYKFVKGETDYRLGRNSFVLTYEETAEKNSDLYEQVLNLTEYEKESLWMALNENYRPENRIYRYKFFSDNCATRPRVKIEECVNGTIVYPKTTNDSLKTYRDYVHHLLKTARWYEFGINMCLGTPTDKEVTEMGRLFLPMELKTVLDKAMIVGETGAKPLVKETRHLLTREETESREGILDKLTPDLLFWLMLIAAIAHIIYYHKTKKEDRWAYATFNTILGIFGLIIFYVSVLSVHEYVSPNCNLLWCSPLHLMMAVLVCMKKADTVTNKLMTANIILNIAGLSIYAIKCQILDPAFMPIMLTEIALSAAWLSKKKKK